MAYYVIMMYHHTKFGYKKSNGSEAIILTNINWDFECFAMTLSMNRAIQYFHWTLDYDDLPSNYESLVAKESLIQKI